MASKLIPIPEAAYAAFEQWRTIVPPEVVKPHTLSDYGYAQHVYGLSKKFYFDSDTVLYKYLKSQPKMGKSIYAENTSYLAEQEAVQAYLAKYESKLWQSLPSESARFRLVKRITVARQKKPGKQLAFGLPNPKPYSNDPQGPQLTVLVVPAVLPA